MKNILNLFILLLMMNPDLVQAQQAVEGQITNSEKKPLEGVTLILKDSSANILSFGRSDQKGYFKITTSRPEKKFILELTSIGYAKKTQYVEAGKPLSIQMEAEAILLEDVVIKNRPVLRNFGDTLDYNPADFANKDDRSIGDVIRKMPGLSMNDDGKIEYNGKAISRFYVDKDNILDDKYNIGAKSIPHSAVEKLQVIEKDQPIKMLRKHNMSDDVAINVVLKKDARIKLMGDIKLGAGSPEKYEGNANAMLFRKNNKFINNLQANNIGTDPSIDLISHNLAGLLNLSENKKPARFLNSGAGGVPVLPANRTLFNRAGLLNLNNLVKWNDIFQLRFNVAYYADRRTAGQYRSSAIYLPGDTVRYTEDQRNIMRPQELQTRIEITGNAEKYYLKNTLSFDLISDNTQSALSTKELSMHQKLTQQTRDFSNELNFRKTAGTKNSFSATSVLAKTSLREKLEVQAGINEDLYNNGDPYKGLFQNLDLPTWYTNHSLAFSRANKISQTYQLSHVFQHQHLASDLFKIITKDPVPVEGNTSNDLDWTFSRLAVRALFEYKNEKLTTSLALPVNMSEYAWKNMDYPASKNNTFLNFEPFWNMRLQTSAENYLSGSFAHRMATGTIEDIYPGAILRDYRSLVFNEAPLSRRITDRISANYQFKKALKMFFWNIGTSYATIRSNTISSYLIEENQEKRTAVYLENQSNQFSLSTSTSKYLFAITSTIKAGAEYSLSRFQQFQNSQLTPFNGRSLALNTGIYTRFTADINGEYEMKYNTSQSFSEGKPMREPYHQFRHLISLNVNTIKDIRLNIRGQFLHTQQPDQQALNYIFADANIIYALKKLQTDLVLNITNLGNVKKFEAINLGANSYTSGVYNIPGRMAVLSARFSFN